MIPCAVLHLLNSLCQAFRCFFMALSRDDDDEEEAIVNKRRRPQVFKPVSSKTAGDKAVSESTSERIIQAKARVVQRRPRLRRGMGGSSSEEPQRDKASYESKFVGIVQGYSSSQLLPAHRLCHEKEANR